MSAIFASQNPVTGEVLWEGPAASVNEIDDAMQRASKAAARWRGTDVSQRIAIVRAFGEQLQKERAQLSNLISGEVGKLPWDAEGEVSAAIAKIELSIQALHQRRFDQSLDDSNPQRWIRYRPLGVVLVLGPFNFPLHLPGGQIIPALLAGNTVVFKPSDQATAVGQWMMHAWEKAGLPDGVMQWIPGGVETAVAAIDSPHVRGVFLTGSRDAGRAIHRQLAGRPDVLLALELGGNNPVVVTDTVAPDTMAKTVSFSSFVSSGQRCTCARRAILIEGPTAEAQIEALVTTTRALRVGLPENVPTPQVGPLISSRAVEGLQRTYQRLLDYGCQPIVPMQVDSNTGCLVHPSIVDASDLEQSSMSAIGQLEWFGPLLVVQRVQGFDHALRAAAETPYGLAASLLGGTAEMFHRFVDEVGAGVVNWNGPTTGAAGTLPFGGLGDSGNHRPAGFFAIDFCSDPIASLEIAEPPEKDPWSIAQ